MTILVAPDDWALELGDTKYPIPGIIGVQAVWDLPKALDIDLLHEKDRTGEPEGGPGGFYRVTFTDPRVSSERDDSMPSGDMGDGRSWFHADIIITVGKVDKIFLMEDIDITSSFLIELDGDMDTAERRAALIALGFREL